MPSRERRHDGYMATAVVERPVFFTRTLPDDEDTRLGMSIDYLRFV